MLFLRIICINYMEIVKFFPSLENKAPPRGGRGHLEERLKKAEILYCALLVKT
jgi:hypothetical protein